MAARNQAGSTAPRLAGQADGKAEASFLQAFLIDLERHGLVHGAQPQVTDGVRGSDGPAHLSRPADIENAVRKLIAVLREPS
jgi:hypothetical protein